MPLGLGIENMSISNKNGSIDGLSKLACIKCKGPCTVLINRKDTYCKTCFLDQTRHKFRSTIAKQRAFKGEQRKGLVAYDGGPSSSTLIRFIQIGLSADSRRKLQIEPILITIITENDPRKIDQLLQTNDGSLIDYLSKTGFDSFIVHLGALFYGETSDFIPLQIPDLATHTKINFSPEKLPGFEHAQKIEELFSSISCETSCIDLKHRLKYLLLQRLATGFDAQKLVLASTARSLANRTLSMVALGRGSQIPSEIAVVAKYPQSCGLAIAIRPMKDFSDKEIALFNYYEQIEAPIKISKDEITTPSIQSITNDFISGLETGFPCTVSTILSTSSKVQGNNSSTKTVPCKLCCNVIDSERELCEPCKFVVGTVVRSDLINEILKI